MFSLNDKIALVTGGTGALGAVMCQALADAGATVIIVARDSDTPASTAERIIGKGGQAVGYGCDVLEKASLETVAKRIQADYGRLDILVNAAGGNHPEATVMPHQHTFFDLPQEAMQWVFNLNLVGTILPSQVFGALMVQQGAGAIVNISSMASFQPLTRVVAYGAAKAAINNFTQWLAVYMATEHSSHLRVNAMAHGFFLGEQNRFLLMNEDDTLTPRGEQIIAHTPMNRFGDAHDLSGTLLWLVSDASRFVTGVVVPVDGGFSAYSGV